VHSRRHMTQHQPWCRQKLFAHSDAAKRLSDVYLLHRVADPHGSIGQWFAAALADGRSDNQLYSSKRECVRHQHHNESYYTFIKIVPSSMNPCEAEVMLSVARRLYDNGMRMADPDDRHGGLDLIKRISIEDQLPLMKGIVTNVRMPREADR